MLLAIFPRMCGRPCRWAVALELAEAWLIKRGVRVIGIPLDPVIGASATARGVELVHGDFIQAKAKLKGLRFDCLLVLNVLHLVSNPSDILELFGDLLRPGATVIVLVPNVSSLSTLWRRVRKGDLFSRPSRYEQSGVQFTSHRLLKNWLRR